MEDNWENLENDEVKDIVIQKIDDDGKIIVEKPLLNEKKQSQEIKLEQQDQEKPKIQKETIFKGLSLQQKKQLLTHGDLKTEKQYKELGKKLAELLQKNGNQFGVYDFTDELLNLLQPKLKSNENLDISNKLKVLSNDRNKIEKNDQKIKEQKEKEQAEQEFQLKLQQKLQQQTSKKVEDDDFM